MADGRRGGGKREDLRPSATAAATLDLQCPTGALQVVSAGLDDPDARMDDDDPWGFLAAGCGRSAYYRCWFKPKTLGRTRCCARVADEGAATEVFHASSSEEQARCFDSLTM